MKEKNQNDLDILLSLSKYLPAIPFMVVFAGVAFIIAYAVHPTSDPFTAISSISAFFTVVLTSLYVAVNSKQLDIMKKQLNEMKNDRELQNQPLPWVCDLEFSVEKPQLFFTPPENDYTNQSRYRLKFAIKNVSSTPAVCVDVSSYIPLSTEVKNVCTNSPICMDASSYIPSSTEKKSIKLKATSTRIDTLEGMSKFPASEDDYAGFLFIKDTEGLLLHQLIGGNILHYPIITIRVI